MAALLDALKRHLDKTTVGDDALLTDILEGAVAAFERATGRSLAAPEQGDPLVSVVRPVVGGIVRLPDARFVQSVTSTDVGASLIDPAGIDLQGWNYDGTAVWAVLDCDVLSMSFPKRVTVVGRFGMTPLPADVREAVILLAAHRYRMRGAEATGQWEDGDAVMGFPRLPPAYSKTVKDFKVPTAPISTISLGWS